MQVNPDNNRWPHQMYDGPPTWINMFRVIFRQAFGERHIDYGCGLGVHTTNLSIQYPDTEFTGYDPDEMRIQRAIERLDERRRRTGRRFDNLILTSQKPNGDSTYDSASMMFVLQVADPGVLDELANIMEPGSTIGIVDYNLKGVPLEDFERLWVHQLEQEEIERIGLEATHRRHTCQGPLECLAATEKACFRTQGLIIVPDPFTLYEKYFIWAGKRVR